ACDASPVGGRGHAIARDQDRDEFPNTYRASERQAMSDPAIHASSARAARRRAGLLALGTVVLLCGLAYGAWWLLVGRFHETTDDAYVAGNIVAVTARENATVMALHVDNTQQVRRGQLLVEMDPAVAQVRMQAAEARLAGAVRAVRGNFAGADTYRAQLTQ